MNDLTLPLIDQQACTQCGRCAAICPADALALENGEVAFVNPQACTYCTLCEGICPVGAIRCGFTVRWDTDA